MKCIWCLSLLLAHSVKIELVSIYGSDQKATILWTVRVMLTMHALTTQILVNLSTQAKNALCVLWFKNIKLVNLIFGHNYRILY